jgi:hypothetical protein
MGTAGLPPGHLGPAKTPQTLRLRGTVTMLSGTEFRGLSLSEPLVSDAQHRYAGRLKPAISYASHT